MIIFLTIAICAVWLLLGWHALEGDIDAPNDFLWLIFYGIPAMILIVVGFIIIFFKNFRIFK